VAGEFAERPGPASHDQPSVAEVEVVEEEFADRFGAGRVHGGQGEGDAGGRLGRGDAALVPVVAVSTRLYPFSALPPASPGT
jgi:hypothetical protein